MGRSRTFGKVAGSQTANDPASVVALPGHGSTNPQQETEMNSPKANTEAAPAASAAVRDAVDQLGYAVNEMRMFASVLETIISAKLSEDGVSNLLLPGIRGTHLFPIEAEEIIFLSLKVDNMAKKLDAQFDALVDCVFPSNRRAA